MSELPLGDPLDRRHRAGRRSSRACRARGPLRGRRDRVARRGRARPPRPSLGIPRAHGSLRGAPRRPGRRRGLHPAAEPPPRRVDDRGRPGRQARPVREAAGDDRGRRRADGRRVRGRGRAADGGVHVPPPSRRGSRCASSSRPGGSAGSSRSRAGSRTSTTTRRNIRNIRAAGGGALFDIGCYAVNLSRMLFDAEPSRVEAAIARDAASGVDVVTSAILEFAERASRRSPARPGSRPTSGSTSTAPRAASRSRSRSTSRPTGPPSVLVVAGGDPPVAPGRSRG